MEGMICGLEWSRARGGGEDGGAEEGMGNWPASPWITSYCILCVDLSFKSADSGLSSIRVKAQVYVRPSLTRV